MTIRVGVVGGGILGMTLSLELERRGYDVTLFEAERDLGGLAAPADLGGFTWDRFYHVIAPGDAALLGLLRELELEHTIRWRRTRTGFFDGTRLYSLSSTIEFLTFPLLGAVDKLRLAATVLHASRIHDWQSLERMTAVEWLSRWSGKRAVDRLWVPLLRAKLGQNYDRASAAFICAIIARMYGARRAGAKREMFGYVSGGYATVLERLRRALELAGVRIRSGTPVAEVGSGGDGVRVVVAGGSHTFDRVVLTVPTPLAARLCPMLAPAERDRLNAVQYQGVVCASLVLARPLGGFYVTNITDGAIPFTGVIEMTALVDPGDFGGHTLVYLPRYLAQDADGWEETDDQVVTSSVAGLRRIYPDLDERDVLVARVARARYVQAIATLDYSTRLRPALQTSIPGVYLVTAAQIVAGTLNNNEVITLAQTRAAELATLWARTTDGAEGV